MEIQFSGRLRWFGAQGRLEIHVIGNKFTVNMWSYRKLVDAIVNKLHEYGISTYLVVEYNTSRFCAYHDVKVERKPRGVVNCPLGHKLHSDVNGALNIMRLGVKKVVDVLRKPLSFLVSSNGVSPLKGSNALDLGGTLALQGGEWVSSIYLKLYVT
jgi:putative transposase